MKKRTQNNPRRTIFNLPEQAEYKGVQHAGWSRPCYSKYDVLDVVKDQLFNNGVTPVCLERAVHCPVESVMVSFNFDAPLKVKMEIIKTVSAMKDADDPAFAAQFQVYRDKVDAEIAAAAAAANDSDESSDESSVTGKDPAAPHPVADETGGGANQPAGVFHKVTVSKNGDVYVPVITGGASGKNTGKPGYADVRNSVALHCLAVDNLVNEILANGNEALTSLHVRLNSSTDSAKAASEQSEAEKEMGIVYRTPAIMRECETLLSQGNTPDAIADKIMKDMLKLEVNHADSQPTVVLFTKFNALVDCLKNVSSPTEGQLIVLCNKIFKKTGVDECLKNANDKAVTKVKKKKVATVLDYQALVNEDNGVKDFVPRPGTPSFMPKTSVDDSASTKSNKTHAHTGADKATGGGGKGSGGGTTTKGKGKGGGGGGHGPNALAFAAWSGGKVTCHRCGEEGHYADGCYVTVEMIAKLVKDAKRSKTFPTSAPTPKSVPRGVDGSTSKAKQSKPKGIAKSNAVLQHWVNKHAQVAKP